MGICFGHTLKGDTTDQKEQGQPDHEAFSERSKGHPFKCQPSQEKEWEKQPNSGNNNLQPKLWYSRMGEKSPQVVPHYMQHDPKHNSEINSTEFSQYDFPQSVCLGLQTQIHMRGRTCCILKLVDQCMCLAFSFSEKVTSNLCCSEIFQYFGLKLLP